MKVRCWEFVKVGPIVYCTKKSGFVRTPILAHLADFAQNVLKIVAHDLRMHTKFGPDQLGFAGVILN